MPIEPAQLEDVWLQRVRFEANPSYDGVGLGVTYSVEPEVDLGELVTNDEDGSVSAVVRLRAAVKFSRAEEDPGELPFEMEIEIHGRFRWEAPPTRIVLASAWLEYNGMYLLWPYLRSHIATVTGMSELPTLTIYTMNVPKPPVIPAEEQDEQQEQEPAANAATDTPADPEA